jgi:formate/nitrite transporter FocA (FNT family)
VGRARVFHTRLRSVLRGAEGGTGTLSNLVFGAGVIYSALMMASGVTFAAVAYAVGLRDATVSDLDFVKVLPQMAWMILLLGAGFAGLLLVLTASILSMQRVSSRDGSPGSESSSRSFCCSM